VQFISEIAKDLRGYEAKNGKLNRMIFVTAQIAPKIC